MFCWQEDIKSLGFFFLYFLTFTNNIQEQYFKNTKEFWIHLHEGKKNLNIRDW